MMDICFIFVAFSLLSYFNCKNSTVGMIEEIGVNKRYYPQKYKLLPRWMRKFFNVRKKYVPRFLYYELLVSLVFAVLGLFYIMIYLFCGKSDRVGGLLLLFNAGLIIVNFICFAVMSTIYKR